MSGGWREAWIAALDDLELSLEETELLLSGDQQPADVRPWQPPRVDAPLPPDMLERAQALLVRQQQLVDRTTLALSHTRQRLDLVDKVTDLSDAKRPARPVYIDLTA